MVRKKRLNIDTDDNCSHCKQAPDIFYCTARQPGVKWVRREIEAIDPSITKEKYFSIFTLNFSIFLLAPSGNQGLNPVITWIHEFLQKFIRKYDILRKPYITFIRKYDIRYVLFEIRRIWHYRFEMNKLRLILFK